MFFFSRCDMCTRALYIMCVIGKSFSPHQYIIKLRNYFPKVSRAKESRFHANGLPSPGNLSNAKAAFLHPLQEPPILKRDGPKQTRSRAAETVLLE